LQGFDFLRLKGFAVEEASIDGLLKAKRWSLYSFNYKFQQDSRRHCPLQQSALGRSSTNFNRLIFCRKLS